MSKVTKATIIMDIHKLTGLSISECEKVYNIGKEYILLRSAIGDRPEDYVPPEYVLVRKEGE